jgi:lipid-A-disaccharide synthase-like uncharacterized protein
VLRGLFHNLVEGGVYSEEGVPLMYFISKQGSGSVWTGLTPLFPYLWVIFFQVQERAEHRKCCI